MVADLFNSAKSMNGPGASYGVGRTSVANCIMWYSRGRCRLEFGARHSVTYPSDRVWEMSRPALQPAAGKERTMDSITDRASPSAGRGRDEEKREVDYYVRAKTGPGRRDWMTIGVAFTRRNNE